MVSVLAFQWAQAVPGSGLTLVLTLVATACTGSVALAAIAYALSNSKRVAVRGLSLSVHARAT